MSKNNIPFDLDRWDETRAAADEAASAETLAAQRDLLPATRAEAARQLGQAHPADDPFLPVFFDDYAVMDAVDVDGGELR